MSLHFYAYARKGYEFTDDIAHALNSSDTEKAGRLTRCVFRVLRNLLSREDSFRLIANLPMALKAIYVDGWKFNPVIIENFSHDFISELLKEDAKSAWRDLTTESDAKNAIVAVFKVLSKFLGSDEVSHLLHLLPPPISIEITNNLKVV